MPPQPDHSDGPNTLPAAELNPLLNPVLGQNMGRWAEVYFTSPPEKREQAVIELLRELRAENPELEGSGVSAPSSASAQASQPWDLGAAHIAETQEPNIMCRGCGRENPGSHRFCGMCGKLLGEAVASDNPSISDTQVAEVRIAGLHLDQAHPQTAGFHVSDLHIEDRLVVEAHNLQDHADDRPQDVPAALPQRRQTQFIRSQEAVFEPVLNTPVLNTSELSLFQSGSESSYSDGQAEEMFLDSPGPRRYRVYVGIALAAVIFALGYMAWHSSQAESQSSRVEPQAPPAVTAQAATSPAPDVAKSDAPDRTPSASQQAAVASNTDRTNAERASNKRSSNTARNTVDVPARSAATPNPSAERKTPAEVSDGNGAEELTMAQRYLDGTDGQERNQAEGAKWLWKAMAKHNARATLLLADLYLKGEGVSKNCDQARVLLDSATRGGMKEAGERLRHLQAFGCQ